ncbi:molybdenum cofactor guanylyltransferase MobA [Craterilacuibacter sp. RT1T]|uniref:molybdenum cofactor guanylyltransferase MobA n=1 Tax=Craterilacuibacter sp. RT1T TaxID=2942211 RepID=UPI0020BE1E3E|nr:molybdenum cofactor guanylyltransferase MobA [Craterilacuibacter sp. RT1T]MCL6262958.1 molybdenum cofactor guanylyltransferase [Craterilacuibacter sp. RT1T]
MIAGLLLAGGQGQRMGGVDKGLVLLAGQPLALHVIHRLRPQVDVLYISANRSLQTYAQWGQVVCDLPRFAGQGPLSGMASVAACLCDAVDYVLLAPCDMPALPPDVCRHLLAALKDAPAAGAAYAVSCDGPQPAVALVRKEALAQLAPCLDEGQRAIRHWLTRVGAIPVPFADAAAFANANDAQALAALEARFSLLPETGSKHA